MPQKKLLFNPDKVVKVDTYLQLLPTLKHRAQMSKPTVYAHCKAGKLPHIYIDEVLHIILD